MSDTCENILFATGLHKNFGKGPSRVHVLRGVNLSVRRGEFLCIMGPSGCGKTTLLHVLGLISPADEGTLTICGQTVDGSLSQRTQLLRSQIGFVFQRFNLLSVVNAADNIAVSLRVRGLAVEDKPLQLLAELGVSHVARRKPSQMSIGEQQRVAMARALAHEPAILFADEPTGNLDSANSHAMMSLLGRINKERRQTIVMITHSAEVASAADRVLHMKDGLLDG